MNNRNLVVVGGVVVWAAVMIAYLATGVRWLFYLAIIIIVAQVVVSTQMRRR